MIMDEFPWTTDHVRFIWGRMFQKLSLQSKGSRAGLPLYKTYISRPGKNCRKLSLTEKILHEEYISC